MSTNWLSMPAVIWALDEAQMFELIARGEVESVKIGRLRKIPRDALTSYVERLRAEVAVPA